MRRQTKSSRGRPALYREGLSAFSSRPGLLPLLALGALAVLLAAWPRLLLLGLVPLDGNLMAVSFPNWSLLRSAFHEPNLALWNPLRGMGFPQLADPITMTLYPPAWLCAALPDFLGYLQAWTVGHTLLAAAGAAALAWRWHRNAASAAAAALAFACGGFFMGRVTMPHHLAAAAWLPAVWYALELDCPLAAGACLTLQWLAGYPPFSILTALGALALAAPRGRRGLAALARAGLWALALCAAQFAPFLELLAQTGRGLRLTPEQAALFSIPPLQLLKELLLPQWYALRPALEGDPAMVCFYLGAAGLALAAWGAWRGGSRERLLAAMAGTALLLSLGSHLPGFSRLVFLHAFRYPCNWLLLASAAGALLCAAGVSRLPGRWAAAAAAALAADLLLFALPPKTAWARPEFLTDRPALARPGRVYHTERLMRAWGAGRLETEEDYLLMKDLLAPCYGMAFGTGSLSDLQTLRLRRTEAYRAKLAAPGADPRLLDWAGAGLVIDLDPESRRVERTALKVSANPSAYPRLFSPDGAELRDVAYRPGRVSARVRSARPARVVLAEMDYPGWSVSVDGKPAGLEPFAGSFLSAPVPTGEHEIAFRYRPRAFLAGAAVSLAALALACAALLL